MRTGRQFPPRCAPARKAYSVHLLEESGRHEVLIVQQVFEAHHCGIRDVQAAGFMPRLAQEEAVQLSTVLALVEGGFGVALIPEVVANCVRRRVTFHRLSGSAASLDTGLGILHPDGELSAKAALFREAVLSLDLAK